MSETKIEIERRFLLKRLPVLHHLQNHWWIDQFYVTGSGGVERFRTSWDNNKRIRNYERIVKRRISPGVNGETTISPITEDDYYDFFPKKERIIKKKRYIFEENGLTFEVDEFVSLKLVICEVELKSLDQEIIFPDYIKCEIIKEITGQEEFSNYNLAI